MPQFSYKARRRTGEVVEGMLEVADRSAALIQIERLGLFPVAVDAAKAGAIALALLALTRPPAALAGGFFLYELGTPDVGLASAGAELIAQANG